MSHLAGSQAILAAYAISGNIDRLCTVAVMALSGATGIIIGREIGTGKKDEVYDIGRALDILAFLALRSFNTTNVVGVLRGGGDVKMASFIDPAPLWFAAVPAAALCGLVFRLGILWVRLSIQLENIIKFFISLRRLRDATAE